MNASAQSITKSSKSNLALAFVSLPRERRADMTTFYAFCRIVDDIADEPGNSPVEKRAHLERWKRAIEQPIPDAPELAEAVRALVAKYGIPLIYLQEILAGVAMDIEPERYATFEDLRLYCYRVASAVGLASIEIFGYKNPGSKEYATDLGMALQLTNILRDVGQDFANGGRIYLPLEDLERFHYPPESLANRAYNSQFVSLMNFEAARAVSFFEKAEAGLPQEDRKSMTAAEIMRRVYRKLLAQMQRDGFRVFDKRYSLTRLEKTLAITGALANNYLTRALRRPSSHQAPK